MECEKQPMESTENELILELKERLKSNKDYKKLHGLFDDKFFLVFIRGRKYNIDRAYETISNFMKTRTTKYPEFFRSMVPSNVTSLDIGFFRVLKSRDRLQRPVVVDRIRLWDSSKHSAEDAMKTMLLFAEELMSSEIAQKHGIVMIFDMGNFSLKQVKEFTFPRLFKARNLYENAMPLEYKEIHVVNETSLFSLLFKATKHIIPKKVRDRIFMHSDDLTSLHQYFSPSILPDFLGGTVPENEAFDKELITCIRDKEEYYQKLTEYIV